MAHDDNPPSDEMVDSPGPDGDGNSDLVADAEDTDDIEDVDRLTEEEVEDLNEAEESVPPVTYSGQDFDVIGLVRRLNNEDVLVPIFGHNDERISSAGFQRGFVWSRPQMDRFIESLLLGYPIPGVFFVRQADRRYLVLDGQQRLRTLQHFANGVHAGREFALQNVANQFKGLTYKAFTDEQRRLFDDAFIQATIVSTDGSGASLDSVYKIFERLNAGGTQLTPHEIRVALYAGTFIDFLETLNRDAAWRSLYGKRSPRLRDQELILRILALFGRADRYRRPLKAFLNDYSRDMRAESPEQLEKLGAVFINAAMLVRAGAGRGALRRQGAQVNAALTEAVFVGLMRRVDSGELPNVDDVEEAIRNLRANDELQWSISRATADEENVKKRLEVATAAFAEV